MRDLAIILTAVLGLTISPTVYAASEHGGMDHSSMQGMEHGGMKGMEPGGAQRNAALQEGELRASTVEGYRFGYQMADMMKGMAGMKGHDMSQMKSHHLMVYIAGPDGKAVEDAKVGYMVAGPGDAVQKTMAMGMGGGYGADIDLKAKGPYKITTKAVVGGKSLVDEFSYEVK